MGELTTCIKTGNLGAPLKTHPRSHFLEVKRRFRRVANTFHNEQGLLASQQYCLLGVFLHKNRKAGMLKMTPYAFSLVSTHSALEPSYYTFALMHCFFLCKKVHPILADPTEFTDGYISQIELHLHSPPRLSQDFHQQNYSDSCGLWFCAQRCGSSSDRQTQELE